MEYKCYCCGQLGHKSPQCPLRDKIAKDDWIIWKATVNYMIDQKDQEINKEPDEAHRSREVNKSQGWSAAQYCLTQTKPMKKSILLDSGSTTSLFANPNYFKNIIMSNNPMEI